jgi:shikimate kinase
MNVESNSIIVLLGYMGSGKTTVGQELASVLGHSHLDLDHYIESRENSTISQIIKEKGIIYFRKQEKICLEQILSTSRNLVLSLGGGTPCYYDNMKSIVENPKTMSIYLRANVPFLTQRLFPEISQRPLISQNRSTEELAEFIGKHLLERSIYYDQAKLTVSIQGKSPEQITQEIIVLI